MTKELRQEVIEKGVAYTRKSMYVVCRWGNRFWIMRADRGDGRPMFENFLTSDEVARIKYAPSVQRWW